MPKMTTILVLLLLNANKKTRPVYVQDSSPDSVLPTTQKKLCRKTFKCDVHAHVRLTTIAPSTFVQAT